VRKIVHKNDWIIEYNLEADLYHYWVLIFLLGKYQKDTGSSVSTIFNWYYQDDDATFQLVDNTKTQKNKYGQKRFQKGGLQQKQKQQQGWQQQRVI
jgi:hypothetical protein